MSRFPVIDSPCPLRFASMPQAGRDHCGHCDRQVNNLDGMSSAQRETFMRSCEGSKVCVAYTVHRRAVQRNVTLGVGLAATMLSSAAMAQDLPDATAAAPRSPVPTTTQILPDDSRALEHIEVTGGVVNPGKARWSDESDIETPDTSALPEIGENDWLPTQTAR